jgi:hypothetical protein
MTKQPKIFVFHLKEFIYTLIFFFLGIAFVLLIIAMFSGSKETETSPQPTTEYILQTTLAD